MRLTVPASWTHRGRPGPRGKGKALPVPEGTATAPLPARRKAARPRLDLEPSEDAIQIALINHLKMRAVPGLEVWHVPNGGARSKVEAARFKAMGVLAGLQDIHLLHCGTLYVLEIKRRKGRLSPEQRDMGARMTAAGAVAAVAYGLDAAIAQLEAWGLIRPDRSGS